ncbi:MAG: T9SS C-terminal target domain-containing protein [Crocinitomicaceae bacterium]|nr:T9SS C-terminal target domain-containing protein [Crocinitomicaceae bacterium]
MKKKLLGICLLLMTPSLLFSQIAAWDFTGENNVATSTAEVYNANLDASNTITRGAGAVGSAGANSFRTQGFQNNGIALTNTDYFQNQFSAAPGFTLSLTSINARFAGTTSFFANPGVSMQYAYSLDGTNFTLIGSPFSMTAIGAMPAIDLSGVSALQNVAENITVTIRFYASGQTTTGGWGYNSPSSGSYGLAFGGTLNCLVQSTFYADTDNDTFGDVNTTIQACAAPAGYVSNATDCDDTNPAINPNTIWYLDADNDMSGDAANTVTSCTEPTSASYVLNSSDCDDNNPNVDSITTWYLDSDNDGFGNLALTTQNCGQPVGYVANSTDCDDTNNQNNPNATEVFDGVDNNCNTIIDEGFILTTYYEDLDNDGFGGDVSIQSVTNPGAGYVLIGGDCNDNNNAINPNATDILGNGIDEDCSGSDANLPPVVLGIYEFTQPSGCPVTATAVTNQPSIATFSAFSSTGITCQAAGNVYNNNGWNTTATIDLTEYVEFSITANECQSLDLDRIAFNHRCSATGGTPTWYVRSSLDNYATNLGTGLSGNNNNQNLDDTVTLGSAFDAVSNLTFRLYLTGIGTSGATFRFDNVSLYGNSIALPTQTFYADTDNDGFGNLANDSISCTTPIGFVLNNSDCNDADSLINQTTIWFLDADGDLIGGIAQTFVGCTPPTGYVLSNNDCDDSNINITGSTMYYADADNDTYGDFATGALFCTNPGAGYVTNSLDCDDTNNAIFPGATEICDGIDNDCVGGIDNGLTFVTYYVDADLDGFGTGAGQSLCTNPGAGFVTIAGDCNDTDDQINPDSPEVCDGIDNNCAGGIDDGLTFVAYFTDTDDDGFGTGNGQIYCENPGAGFVTVGGDCNDNNNQIYPGATEVLDNSIDENCDGVDGYVGINELTLANFKIVPNPNNGTFNVILSEEVNNATISIQDLNGKTVQTSTFSGLEFQANLTGVTTGVYFVKIQTENSIAVEKVIIK